MRNGKAIEDFIDACLETARKKGLQRSELGKLLEVLVVTRTDLSESGKDHPMSGNQEKWMAPFGYCKRQDHPTLASGSGSCSLLEGMCAIEEGSALPQPIPTKSFETLHRSPPP